MASGGGARLRQFAGANCCYAAALPAPHQPSGARQTVAGVELALGGPELQGRPSLTEAKGGESFLPQSGRRQRDIVVLEVRLRSNSLPPQTDAAVPASHSPWYFMP